MKFVHLRTASMYRDGGSLEATFTDSSGTERSLFLQASRMPDDEGYHHRDLYPCRYRHSSAMPEPILKGSDQEREWLNALAAWIRASISDEKLADLRTVDWSSPTAASDWTMDDWKLHYVVLLYDHIPKRI